MKVIKSLWNRWIFLKKITRKIASQKRELLNFLRPLMKAGLTLGKSVLLARLSAGILATDSAIHKKMYESGTKALIFLKKTWKT